MKSRMGYGLQNLGGAAGSVDEDFDFLCIYSSLTTMSILPQRLLESDASSVSLIAYSFAPNTFWLIAQMESPDVLQPQGPVQGPNRPAFDARLHMGKPGDLEASEV
jgi:hypothetical protein